MKIVAIVQARMGSSRFPGKVMKQIGGVPVIWHTLQRLKWVPDISEVVLATSHLKADDPVAAFAAHEGIPVFRGSHEDVLERYYMAAKAHGADTIVRITGDCPFIDIEVTSRTIRLFLDEKPDYASNTLERTFPKGTDSEVFSFSALEKAYHKAVAQQEREHVTLYMYSNPAAFICKGIRGEKDLSYIRHCIDYERDYFFARALFHHLADENIFFSTRDVVRAIERYPWLLEINRSLAERPARRKGIGKSDTEELHFN